jgi:hypothetical protein
MREEQGVKRIIKRCALLGAAMTGIVVSQTGCAAVAVGGLIWHDSKSREQRQAFQQEFNQHNLERAKLGLPALDFCTEAQRADQTWATDLQECKQ